MRKLLLNILGYTSVGLAIIGIALPLLPTTPFLLLAVFCFSHSSPKMNRWLLQNRFVGKYLRDYEDGQGIPIAIKISAIITLWASIGFTALVFIDHWWLKILLFAIATFVSVHILMLKTCRNRSNVLILFPTIAEQEGVNISELKNVIVEIIGVGPYTAACNTMAMLEKHRPRWVILAGIAGAYPDSDLAVGQSVLVGAETSADQGSFSESAFEPKFSERIECTNIHTNTQFNVVESNSVTTAATPFIKQSSIENMEGIAFFYACKREKVRFLELRTISNYVGDPFTIWNIPIATQRLGSDLKILLDEIYA